MIDDKLLLAEMKRVWEPAHKYLSTLGPLRALAPHNIDNYPAANLTVERIGDLVDCDRATFAWQGRQ